MANDKKENRSHDSISDAGRSSSVVGADKEAAGGGRNAGGRVAPASPKEEAGLAPRKKTGGSFQRQIARPKRVAFLNFPFRPAHQRIAIALIAGLAALGIDPRIVPQDPRSDYRLKKLKALILQSRFSFHDLSYVHGLNMAFELGLTMGSTAAFPA